MASLLLKRVTQRPTMNQGVLIGPGNRAFAVTLELPWRDNKTGISSIPQGTYTCRRVKSPKFGWTFEITNVPGRKHVLFHPANWVKQLRGCVAVGHGFDFFGGDDGITKSQKEFDEFMALQEGVDEFQLTVINV